MSAVDVKINYEKRKSVPFRALKIGDAYSTVLEPSVPCIKTSEFSCIYYYNGEWDSTNEKGEIEVYPIAATIEFFGIEEER